MTGCARLLAVVVALAASTCATEGASRGGAGAAEGVADLRLPRHLGGEWDLGTERGNVVLLNYFATWCVPCVAEWPLLVELQNRYRSAGLRVVAVSMDTGSDAGEVLSVFLGHFDETNFPILRATARTHGGEPWAIGRLPTTVMIGRDGKPLGKWEGMLPPDETEALVRDLVLAGAAR